MAQDVYVFGMYNGQWAGARHKLHGYNGKIFSSKDTGKMISHANISVKYNQFIVDNVTDGFDIHQLDNGAHIHTLPTGILKKRVPKQVTFVEDSQIIVGGSDHGIVYLFEGESGRLITTLNHSADKGLVQTMLPMMVGTCRWRGCGRDGAVGDADRMGWKRDWHILRVKWRMPPLCVHISVRIKNIG
ncbi:hypothetical protein K439DRAFT_1618146 [Ramaria rubella]|nr:hypothetical protein K439DRAFT_1618146 [Ramaria rubella]